MALSERERERESCGLRWIFAGRYGGQRERDRQTHMDRWRLREELTEGSERENEGKETDRCTDKQTVGVGGDEVRQPRKKNLTELHYCYSAVRSSGVLWTTIFS